MYNFPHSPPPPTQKKKKFQRLAYLILFSFSVRFYPLLLIHLHHKTCTTYYSQVYFSVTNTVDGFTHSLAPIKKAKSGKLYFNVHIRMSHSALHFQTTKILLKVVNINRKNDAIFVNLTSFIQHLLGVVMSFFECPPLPNS